MSRSYFLVSQRFMFGLDWGDRPHCSLFITDRPMVKPARGSIMYRQSYYDNGIDIFWRYSGGGAIKLKVKEVL